MRSAIVAAFGLIVLADAAAAQSVEQIGDWEIHTKVSALDGWRTVTATVQSREPDRNEIGMPERASITALCSNSRLGLVFDAPSYIRGPKAVVTWRSGDARLQSWTWDTARSGDVIAVDPKAIITFMESLDDRGDLLIRIGPSYEGAFGIREAAAAWGAVRAAC